MAKKLGKSNSFIAASVVAILLSVTLVPLALATNVDRIQGFDKGPSYKPVVPVKKITFVGYDEETYLDDYAYLAAVPTAVFRSEDKLFSNPLLFYQDEYPIEDDKERSLNARQGLDYFMEDWMRYSNGRLDKMTLINVPMNKLDSTWKSKEYDLIESESPYDIAARLALNEWSYSDGAVVAVIENEFEKPGFELSSEIEDTITSDKEIITKSFFTDQLDKLNPRPHDYEVPQGYKYFKARTWWSSLWFGTPQKSALPLHINATVPTADPDTQFYCQYDNDWMQVAVTQGWNIGGMDREKTEAYIYNSGKWYLTVTDIPTFGPFGFAGRTGKIIDVLRNMLKGTTYQTDITLYPGFEKEIPEAPPFGCRDATFKLTWDNPSAKLGLTILGPYGEEIMTSSSEDQDYQEIHLDQLGELPDERKYKICVFALNDISGSVDYKLEYSWHQNYSEEHGNSLSSATEGAVLASQLNAPLLYTSADSLNKCTGDALYKLGVENVYLVNIGNELKKDAKEEIKEIADIEKEYVELEKIYEEIMSLTGQNDVIFSTIDPWTQWLVTEMKPGNETEAGLFIGPAAYCAAHHGSPVLIVDMHPELSSAVVWHTEFWKRHASGFHEPTIAPMYLTVKKVIEFLKELGIDKEGVESMITVSGQYEIGATWDRAFVGNTNPGRIYGSPVDTAYWISRNVFYPGLIFNNPGMNPQGVDLIQGSSSERRKLFPWGSIGLKVTKPSQEENFNYPVLQLYVTYNQRLNDRFEKYYGFQYKSADNIVFGVTPSDNPIDEGVVPGKEGQQIWPDYTDSEVTPFYLTKGGYSNVFSTNFEPLMENLNKGVLLFISHTHGTGAGSGLLVTWDPDDSIFGYLPNIVSKRFGYTRESNPWRGYDWYLGSTEDPDTMTMEVNGILPALLGNPNMNGLLPIGEDYWPSERPILHFLTNLPIIKWFMPEWAKDSSYYKDGIIGSHTISGLAVSHSQWTGYSMDDRLENLYSCGWINSACLPAYKYMHLTMIRHGSVYQVIDPWSTSWYAYWSLTMPRDIVLGDTVGEAYRKGISHVGILHATDPPQWWWDSEQNVCFFGDPDLRMYVPNTEYSNANYWEKGDTEPLRYDEELDIDGHMPFGATGYPHEKEPLPFWLEYLVVIIIIVASVILLMVGVVIRKKK